MSITKLIGAAILSSILFSVGCSSKDKASPHATASPLGTATPHASASPHSGEEHAGSQDATGHETQTEEAGHGKAGEGPDKEWMELTNLVDHDVTKGDVADALPKAESALELARQKGDPRLMVTSLHNLGKIRLSQGQTEECIKLFEQAVTYGEKVHEPDERLSVLCLNKLAAALYAAEESGKARHALQRALELLEKKDPFRIELLQNLAAVYTQEGNSQAAAALAEQIRVLKIQEREPPPCSGFPLIWSSRLWPGHHFQAVSELYFNHKFGENPNLASSRYVWRKYPPPLPAEGEATPKPTEH